MSAASRLQRIEQLLTEQALAQVGGAAVAFAPDDASEKELNRQWTKQLAPFGLTPEEASERGIVLVHRIKFPKPPAAALEQRQREIAEELAKLRAEQERLHASDIGIQLDRRADA